MTVMSVLMTVIGVVLIYIGAVRGGKGFQSIVAFVVGSIYLYVGLFIVVDPPLNLTTIGTVLGIIGGTIAVGRLTIWGITKTDLYQNLNGALLAVPKIEKNVSNFKEKWENEHNIKD